VAAPTKIIVSGDDDIPIAIFNIATGNALDALHFIAQLIDLIGLEQLAQREGRTFAHPLAQSVGAIRAENAASLDSAMDSLTRGRE
jgi:hypothetical protein